MVEIQRVGNAFQKITFEMPSVLCQYLEVKFDMSLSMSVALAMMR